MAVLRSVLRWSSKPIESFTLSRADIFSAGGAFSFCCPSARPGAPDAPPSVPKRALASRVRGGIDTD